MSAGATTHPNTRAASAVWTPLATRLGLTARPAQRAEILHAAAAMTWSPAVRASGGRRWEDLGLSGPTRAVAAFAAGGQPGRIRWAGAAEMSGGRRLIGLHDPRGVRTFLLEDGAETVHVLVLPACQPGGCLYDRLGAGAVSAPGPDEEIRRAALSSLIDAYVGSTYRLLVDLGYALGLPVAYVDRQTVEAHLERDLTGQEWSRINAQFRPMDFTDHVGDLGQCRTEWIASVLARARIVNGQAAAITPSAACGAP